MTFRILLQVPRYGNVLSTSHTSIIRTLIYIGRGKEWWGGEGGGGWRIHATIKVELQNVVPFQYKIFQGTVNC